MGCKHYKLGIKSNIGRVLIGSIDRCTHMGKVKGIHFEMSINKECPLKGICKYYKEGKNGN